MADQVRSGWYDDPDDPDQLRYFDGILWTERRMPKRAPGLAESSIGTAATSDGASDPGTEHRPQGEQHSSNDPSQQRPADGPQQTQGGNPYAAPPAGHGNGSHGSYPAGEGPAQQGGWQPTPEERQKWAAGGYPFGHHQPNHVPGPTGPTTPDGRRISGWGRRFGAYVVDNLICSTLAVVLAWPFMSTWVATVRGYVDDSMSAAAAGKAGPEMPSTLSMLPWQLALSMLLVYAIYEIGMTVWRGQTLGKMLFGLSVRHYEDDRLLTLNEAGSRFLVKGISAITNPVPVLGGIASVVTIVDGLWPLGDARRQALHDKLPKSVVVVGRTYGRATPPARQDETSDSLG